MVKVFQYGSNACSARLNGPNRLDGDARVIGRAETIEDYDITFDVFSTTNQCAASDIVPSKSGKAWGVLYDVPEELVRGKAKGRRTLQEIEGLSYEETSIRVVVHDDIETEAVTFLVKEKKRTTGLATSVWYVSWILYGLREHHVPEDYINHVLEVAMETNKKANEESQKQIDLMKHL